MPTGDATDSRLLGDGVRVLSRVLRRTKRVLADGSVLLGTVFRSRTRSVRRLAQRIHRLARRQGDAAAEAMRTAYTKLLDVTAATCRQTERVTAALRNAVSPAARRLVRTAERFLPLVRQAIGQADRRVLRAEAVPAREKLVSLFEPHTPVHVRQKAGTAVEFGRKVLLDEVEGGIVTRCRVLPTAGTEHEHLEGSVVAHRQRFGRAPDLLAGDRGFSSARNEQMAREAGVRRVVLPRTGRVSAERRALARYGLGRCREHGEAGLQRWVDWGILAHNLAKIADTVAARAA